jgi:hemolysin III
VKLGKMQNPVRGLLHGTAAVVFAVGAAFLWTRSAPDISRKMTLLVFGLSLVALYTASSLYHSFPWRRVWKERMQRVDHSMIYVLVAGTYTPLAFVVLDDALRWATLCTIWGIALIGIGQEAFLPKLGRWFVFVMPTLQGWLGLFLVVPLAQRLPPPALFLTLLGGLFYTVGMVFLATKRPRLWPRVFSYHEMFHVFVVSGSAAHYAMTFWYVAPFPGA